MDCFDAGYYRVNRELLSLVGQWPYQSYATKVTRRILYLTFLGLTNVPQMASALTEELDFNARIEIICGQVLVILVMSRCFLFVFNQAEMLKLLEIMKFNWRSLADNDEHNIFNKTVDEANFDMVRYTIIIISGYIANAIFLILQPLLWNTNLTNNSTTQKLFYQAKYFVDEEKYFYIIVAHMILVGVILFLGVQVSDSFFVVLMFHTVGMFRVACHQLEHAFDNCHDTINGPSDGRTVCQRIACAVEWHNRAIRFCNGIVITTQWPTFVSIISTILDISLALYWVFMSKGHGLGPILVMTLMFHAFRLFAPAQKIVDSSTDITFKAYSSLWYMAPIKEQTLLLLTMQRGLRPCSMQMGKIHPMTLENYATVVKTAFSYFTVLMSVK